ncbi:arginine--tRNA ligase [Patescibacteria group bacterium]|nr:arginine--tRNA ligase [Patescibacteria group bacterium]
MVCEKIEEAVREALATLGAEDVFFVVERPRDMRHGDYATNAALMAKVDANDLAAKLNIDGVEKVEVVGKFINFFLSREAIQKEVKSAASDPLWGRTSLYGSKTVMVEYTDPNPFKEFHIGHLMSNAIGESIARLLEYSGAAMVRANYQGDVGLHVAKAMWGKMQKPSAHWGEAYVYGSEQYDTHKQDIDEINKKVYEKSDEEINKLYDEGRTTSLEHFEALYKMLGTKFDTYFFESEATPLGTAIVTDNPELFVESDGARVFRGEEEGLHTRVFLTSQGLPTYEAKELGLLKLKSAIDLDTSISITANEQSEYFKVVLAAAAHITELKRIAAKTMHISHGMMRFADSKMSSRKGNVITGESLLKDLTKAARGREDVAVGAIKYTVLKSSSGKDIIFDPVRSLSLAGDSGPYVQYALVRARALLRKAKNLGASEALGAVEVGKTWPSGPERRLLPLQERNVLERLLIHFPAAVARAAQEMEPHYVVTYLTELASLFNSWYAAERVIVDGTVADHALDLVRAVEQTLTKGLWVLGIPAPEEM